MARRASRVFGVGKGINGALGLVNPDSVIHNPILLHGGGLNENSITQVSAGWYVVSGNNVTFRY